MIHENTAQIGKRASLKHAIRRLLRQDAPLAGVVLGLFAAPVFAGEPFPPLFDLATIDGSNGSGIQGIKAHDQTGQSVSDAGDFNGDGFGDVIIGAKDTDPNGRTDAGQAYVVFGHSSAWGPTFQLASLLPQGGGDGSRGFVIWGAHVGDRAGETLANAGDVNGDGISDLVVGAPWAPRQDAYLTGEVYVVFGRRGGFNPIFDLRALRPEGGGDGSKGFVVVAEDRDDRLGSGVSGAGDLNGDGIDDLVIGAGQADPVGRQLAGKSYVIFGRTDGFPPLFRVASLSAQNGGDGSAGFVISGVREREGAGQDVYGPGDMNGDGIDDVAIRANGDANGVFDAGKTYVIFGRRTGFPADFELAVLLPAGGGDGSQGFIIDGARRFESQGALSAGDFNADGLADLVIGSSHSSRDYNEHHQAGATYVLFGRSSAFPAEMQLRDLFPENGGDGSAGFVLDGVDKLDRSGSALGGTSDANGDGIDDILIGAYGRSQSFLIYGSKTPFPARIELGSLLPDAGSDGSVGFVLDGARLDYAGAAVSGIPDVNGDGLTDLLIGAPHGIVPQRLNVGISYIVFGRAAER